MNIREAIEKKLGLGPKPKKTERDLDAVTLDHTRARKRIAARNHAAAAKRVHRRRERTATAQRHAVQVSTGWETVLLGGPEKYGAMYDNVVRQVRRDIDASVEAELLQAGKPNPGTREFERETRRRTKVALAEVGLEPVKAVR